jgi:hypothetical protein
VSPLAEIVATYASAYAKHQQWVAYLSDLLACGDITLVGLQDLEDLVNSLLSTSSEIHRVASSGDVLDTFSVDSSGENGSGSSSVTSSVVGLGSDVLDESAISSWNVL